MTYWGSGGIANVFLTSELDGGEWSASRFGRFTTGERTPDTQWIEGCLGPTAGLDKVAKRGKEIPVLK
jgi:hypothetical protein